MLLIDDDQPKIAEGQEKRRAAHPRPAPPYPRPPCAKDGGAPWVTPECHSPGLEPNRSSTRARNSLVKAISGNSTSACRPLRKVSATASR